MKSFSGKCLIAFGLLACATFVLSTNAQEEKKGKKGADPTAQMAKKLESVELTDEQKTKFKAICDEQGPKLKEAMAKVSKLLTPEQVKAKQEAQQAAKAAGKKGKEATDAVNEALKLTEEQKKAMADADKELKAAQASFNAAVVALLTDAQKEKAKLGGKKTK